MWALVLLRLILLARWSAVTAATRLRAMAAVPVAAFVMSALSQYLGAAVAVRLFDRLDVLGVAWIRIVVAAAVLAAWRRPWRRSWSRGDLARVVPYGLALVGMNLAFYLAIDRIPLGTAVAIEFAGPIAVTVLGDRRARNLGAAALAAVGVVLLADVEWAGNAAGVCYALGAATLWALYIVFGRRSAEAGLGADGLALGMLVGAAAVAPLGAPPAAPALGDAAVLLGCIAVGVLSSAVPYTIEQRVLATVSAARFALLLAILPVTAALVGLVALGQVPTPAEVAGVGLVVVALVVSGAARSDRRSTN